MARKLFALLAATLLVFAILPAVAAFAAASGTATLTSARTTFPVDNTSVSVRVNNTEPAVVGKTVNYVDVILPAGTAGVVLDERTITAPSGWTAKKDVVGSFQAVTFKNSTTGIAPGQNLVFNIPVDVTRPLNSDRAGTFNVAISSNGGANTRPAAAAPAGSLDIAVKILEVIAGTLGATAPAGVADQGATGGQDIDYGYAMRNHAQQAVNVTSMLSSSEATDAVSGPKVTSVPGDPAASTVLSHDVLLGRAIAADRTSNMTVSATAAGASADPKSRPLTVEWEPDFNFSNLDPTRVRSGMGANYTFRITAHKSGTPALCVSSASLRFAQTSATQPSERCFDRGPSSQQLEFEPTTGVSGASGSYPATITMSGRDANDKLFSLSKVIGTNIIIDNLAPVIQDIMATIPPGQTAIKSGDPVTVTGCIANAVEDIQLSTLRVVLDPDVGDDIPVNVSTSPSSGRCDFTFNGSVSPTFHPQATSAKFVAEVADTAGNIGGAESAPTVVDLLLPDLQNPGRLEASRLIRVQFVDDRTSAIEGGCDPSAWFIDGVPGLVESVSYADGSNCSGLPSDGTGVRLLWLTAQGSRDADEPPGVRYEAGPLNRDPAHDGARNNAPTRAIQTLSSIRPAAPSIVTVERNNGAEAAYSESDANDNVTNYFTRFRGTGDAATEDLQVTFGGARNNYLIQVVNGQGQVLSSKTVNTNPGLLTGREFNDVVRVPIGTTDGTYRRGIRLVGNGNEGDISWFDVVLDTVVPSISSQSLQSDGQTVVVNLNEPLVAGSDFANDWLALETTADGDTFYRAMDVISTDSDTRTITFPLQNASAFRRVHYRLTSENGTRYQDRGGNLMADTLATG